MVLKTLMISLALSVQLLIASDSVPTVHEVYETAKSGDLTKAHQMIETVLKAHPESAKAHYVDAEILAKEGQLDHSKAELDAAKKIDPSLSFAHSNAIHELEAQLEKPTTPTVSLPNPTRETSSGLPWGTILPIAGGVLVLWLLIRMVSNRNNGYNTAYPPSNNGAMVNGYGNSQPIYPNQPAQSSGLGSTIASGLAGGAAAGVGFVAAEELMHHFMDGDHPTSSATPQDTYVPENHLSSNNDFDMGGDDFGIDDTSSWDDGGSSSDDTW